jgi:hypothetical protein
MLTADNASIADIYNTDKSFISLTKFLASDKKKKFHLADKFTSDKEHLVLAARLRSTIE